MMNSTCTTRLDQRTGQSECVLRGAALPAGRHAARAESSGIMRAHQEQSNVNELDDEEDQPDLLQVCEDGNAADDEHHQAEQYHVEAGTPRRAFVAYVHDAHDEQRQAHDHIDSEAYEQQQLDDRVQGTHGWFGCARVPFERAQLLSLCWM